MYQQTESPAISRHFVNLGDSQVHFRLAGSGPPLVLLHQSPTSSAEMATDIEACARFFTVIGIDMPGYGLSDPLPDEHPDIGQVAAVVERVVSALGLDRILLYGFHTGAIVAFEFACRYPERVAAAVVNGLVCIEGEELDDLLAHYNVLPEVTAEGSHLPWLWARLRDQALFFPWYRKTPDARMAFDLHDGAYLDPYLVDFLRAKEGGRPGYQAAFAYPTRDRAALIDSPVYLINFAPDPLAPHPERLPGFPACVTREIFADFAQLQDATIAYLRAHAPDDAEIPRASVGDCTHALRREIVNTEAGAVHVTLSAAAGDQAIVLMHDAGSSSDALLPLARALDGEFGGERRLVALDLPGHGETGAMQLPTYSAQAIAILIGLVLDELGIDTADVVACGASTLVAAELARAPDARVETVVFVDPWFFDDAERQRMSVTYAPKLMPGDYGQHLLEAWYYARDSELYWPWNEPHPENAITRAPDIDPGHVQARTLDVLKAGLAFPRLVRDLLSGAAGVSIADDDRDAVVCARRGKGHEPNARAAARSHPRAEYVELPADADAWPPEVARVLKLRHGMGHNSGIRSDASGAGPSAK